MIRFVAASLWCLFLCWVVGGRPAARAGLTHEGLVGLWPQEVKGYGLTIEKAKSEALKHALRQLLVIVAAENKGNAWQPSVDFVRRHLISGVGFAGPEEEIAGDEGGKIRVKTWIYPLTPLPVQTIQHYVHREALETRARQRQSWVARGLIAAVVAGVATLGLLRWRQGAFSR